MNLEKYKPIRVNNWKEKLKTPEFGYYKFVLTGHSKRKNNLFWEPLCNGEKNI